MRQKSRRELHSIYKKVIYAVVLFLIFGLFGSLQRTVAAQNEQKGSLTIICPVEGMKMQIYHVADPGDAGTYVLNGSFADYQVSMEQESQEEWQGTANILADYVRRDGIKSDASTMSGKDGVARFSDLADGMYLIVGDTVRKQEKNEMKVYTPQVSLLTVPGKEESGSSYDVTAVLKYDETTESEKTRIHVLKVWKDDQEEKRPSSVKVDLLRTDEKGMTTIADTQILSAENQWAYTWENLSGKMSWSVVETEVPKRYKESSDREGENIILTNTAQKTPGQTGTDTKTPTDSGKINGSSKYLPQTGQLWWPVPLMLLAGICTLAVGMSLMKSEKKRNS